jgi:hypothetical protein
MGVEAHVFTQTDASMYSDRVMSLAGPISFPQRAKTGTALSPLRTVEQQETGTNRRANRN